MPSIPDVAAALIERVRALYASDGFIGLHEPRFWGNERKYVLDAIDSTFVSSVGEYVNRFESMIREVSGARHAVATVNGTAALEVALQLAGVEAGDEVLTQPLTFIATANAIRYRDAHPVFLDVDRETMGLSPAAVEAFLAGCRTDGAGRPINSRSGRRVAACVPMHTFGHPMRIAELVAVCDRYGVPVVEDAAESLGSMVRGRMTGTFGRLGIYSLNGNKTITAGGGGAIVTDDETLGRRAKHLTTTAKVPHPYEFCHDDVGYNYRMPNLNAALACAQLEQLASFIERKRWLADQYAALFAPLGVPFVREPADAYSNYWLNAVLLPDRAARDEFLRLTNAAKVMTRPIWRLTNTLPMYADCQTDALTNARWLEERVVNVPSSVVPEPGLSDRGHS